MAKETNPHHTPLPPAMPHEYYRYCILQDSKWMASVVSLNRLFVLHIEEIFQMSKGCHRKPILTIRPTPAFPSWILYIFYMIMNGFCVESEQTVCPPHIIDFTHVRGVLQETFNVLTYPQIKWTLLNTLKQRGNLIFNYSMLSTSIYWWICA